jgi:LAO/AO transport system kinase
MPSGSTILVSRGGQQEIDVASVVDTVCLLSAWSGDDIQAIKAGIIEIADILVATGAPGADVAVKDLPRCRSWNIRGLTGAPCGDSASNGDGIDD